MEQPVRKVMMPQQARQRDYMPQLDALRFFAVFGVMVTHNWHPKGLPGILGDLDWGGLGVRLFFVLSGFLITGILLDCRGRAEGGLHPPMFYLRQFYMRRFLRIFPIYYLVLAAALLLAVPPARDLWPWLATYTINIQITLAQEWPGRFGHFWTLAVEEQFYLLWPWLVLFVPRKSLKPIMLVAIALAPLYRLYAYVHFPFDIGAMDFKAGTFTLGSLDSLAIGALLALLRRELPGDAVQKYVTRLILPSGLVLYAAALAFYHYRIGPSVFFTIGDLGSAMIFAWLVNSASNGFTGVTRLVLEFRPLTYLGKITYGIYVYHNLVPLLLIAVFDELGIPYRVPGRANFLLSTVVTLAIASLSWHLFELPINNLKRRFEYEPGSATLEPHARATHGATAGALAGSLASESPDRRVGVGGVAGSRPLPPAV